MERGTDPSTFFICMNAPKCLLVNSRLVFAGYGCRLNSSKIAALKPLIFFFICSTKTYVVYTIIKLNIFQKSKSTSSNLYLSLMVTHIITYIYRLTVLGRLKSLLNFLQSKQNEKIF